VPILIARPGHDLFWLPISRWITGACPFASEYRDRTSVLQVNVPAANRICDRHKLFSSISSRANMGQAALAAVASLAPLATRNLQLAGRIDAHRVRIPLSAIAPKLSFPEPPPDLSCRSAKAAQTRSFQRAAATRPPVLFPSSLGCLRWSLKWRKGGGHLTMIVKRDSRRTDRFKGIEDERGVQ